MPCAMPRFNRGEPRRRREHTVPISDDVKLGKDVQIRHPGLVNLYGCEVGEGTRIGTCVEIQRGAIVGRACKVSSHTFICSGVTIEDEVFIGHGVMFINDRRPQATVDGRLQKDGEWALIPTRICKGASIGSGAVILCGVTVGENALVGAGAVGTRDVAPGVVVTGVPGRQTRWAGEGGEQP